MWQGFSALYGWTKLQQGLSILEDWMTLPEIHKRTDLQHSSWSPPIEFLIEVVKLDDLSDGLHFFVGDSYKHWFPLLLGGETSQISILILFSILFHPSKQL